MPTNPNITSMNPYRGRGAQWVSREELAQIARQLQVKTNTPDTCTVTHGMDGPTITVRGAAAAGSISRVQITGVHPSSPTGAAATYVYRGNVYDSASGFTGAITTSDVTVIVGQIASGEIVPSGTRSVMAVKHLNRQWLNASGITVTETVYEFDIPRLI